MRDIGCQIACRSSWAWVAGWGLLLMVSAAAAAPPDLPSAKSKGKTDGKVEADPKAKGEDQSEIPAVPYLTVGLLRDASVQADLGLKPDQVKAVQAAIAEVDEPLWQLRDVPVSMVARQLESLLAKLRQQLNTDLTRPQLERLDQIVLQARSWKALVAPDLVSRLGLSGDQVSRLKTALAEARKDRDAAEKEMAGQTTSKQEQARNRLRQAESKRINDVLTKKQQNDYVGLLGKPFDFSRIVQVGCVAPELRGVTAWINSSPISLEQLRGQVVVVHFWAFGCINCIRNLPHYQGWQEKYANSGLTIIGIQTPETDSEKKLENLKRNVIERKIAYPVAFDASSENWKAWGNNMWPSVYLIDKQGRVRNWWYGELNWEGAKGEEFFRQRIEELLKEK